MDHQHEQATRPTQATPTTKQPSFPVLRPLGDSALVIQFGDAIDTAVQEKVRAFTNFFLSHPLTGVVECVPAYTTVTLYYEARSLTYPTILATMRELLASWQRHDSLHQHDGELAAKIVEIPVCYGNRFGPDLSWVASHCGMHADDVVTAHSGASYVVYMLGFSPGFPFLGGLPSVISVPRRDTPRLSIPAGSVGIAGNQTGVYPIASPGGWQLIGRTPLSLFLPAQFPPTLLEAGDSVRFVPITEREFERMAATGARR